MTYPEALQFLYSQLPIFQRIGGAAYKADLKNTIALCDLIGNPQDHLKMIHVAGTNGKGSTSHMIASILQEHGLNVGLYTSPHLKDFRERIRINGKKIRKKFVTSFVEEHKSDFETIQPSFFEMTVALAFLYFFREKVDVAVIEVGLGGRLDSTNIITPLLSVITNISYDHMQFLGDSLVKIAWEKAGIIKPGIPVVIGETQEEIRKVFLDKAHSEGSDILFADSVYSGREIKVTGHRKKSGPVFNNSLTLDIFRNHEPFIRKLKSPLAGEYQKKNILTTIASVKTLAKCGLDIPDETIQKGIRNVTRNTHLQGRWQIISRAPLTICDTGHNEAGLKEVLHQLRTIPFEHLHFVFGAVNDKEIDKILRMLPPDATYYFCKADIPRGLDQELLKQQAARIGLMGNSYPSVRDALKAAQRISGKNDLVFVGGSTFVVAEVV